MPQSIRVFFTKFSSHHIKSVQAATWIITILHKTFNIIGSNLLILNALVEIMLAILSFKNKPIVPNVRLNVIAAILVLKNTCTCRYNCHALIRYSSYSCTSHIEVGYSQSRYESEESRISHAHALYCFLHCIIGLFRVNDSPSVESELPVNQIGFTASGNSTSVH